MLSKECQLCGEVRPVSVFTRYFDRKLRQICYGRHCSDCRKEYGRQKNIAMLDPTRRSPRTEHAKAIRSVRQGLGFDMTEAECKEYLDGVYGKNDENGGLDETS